VVRFVPSLDEERNGELVFGANDFVGPVEEWTMALDTLFGMPNAEWTDLGDDRFSRLLTSREDRDAFVAARVFLATSTARTALLTGIAVFTALALLMFATRGVPVLQCMAGEDAFVDDAALAPTDPAASTTNAEKLAVLANTVWVRLSGGGQPDSELFLAQFRFVLTGVATASSDQSRLEPIDGVVDEDSVPVGAGANDIVVVGGTTFLEWVADGVVSAALDVGAWMVSE
jgi:hypothetical protein